MTLRTASYEICSKKKQQHKMYVSNFDQFKDALIVCISSKYHLTTASCICRFYSVCQLVVFVFKDTIITVSSSLSQLSSGLLSAKKVLMNPFNTTGLKLNSKQ